MDAHMLQSLRRSLAAVSETAPAAPETLSSRLKGWLSARPAPPPGAAQRRRPQQGSWPSAAARLADPDEPAEDLFLPLEAVLQTFGPRRDSFGQRSNQPRAETMRARASLRDEVLASAGAAQPGRGEKFAAGAAETPFFDGDLDDEPRRDLDGDDAVKAAEAAAGSSRPASTGPDPDRRPDPSPSAPWESSAAAQRNPPLDPPLRQIDILSHLAAALAADNQLLLERLESSRRAG